MSRTGAGISAEAADVPPASWQRQMDQRGRWVLLPALVIATLLASVARPDGGGGHTRVAVGAVIAGLAVLWTAGLIRYPVTGVPGWARRAVFTVHLALAAALVWVSPWYGAFAFTAYFLADELGRRGRAAGFTATALVLAAAQIGGYPTRLGVTALAYLLLAVVNVGSAVSLTLLTNRLIDQNTERGRMIAELAEANRLLREAMDDNAALHEQLLAQARAAGVAEERGRLAGEIHDTLAQGFAGVITQLEAARRARADPSEWARHLELADSLARANLTEARRSVRALRPEQLEQASLAEALAGLAREWSRRCQIPADVVTTGAPVRAPAEVETAAFRIAQEALANVARHAGATRARVTLTYLCDTLLVDIADDGAGFDAHSAPPAGRYGVSGMRRRAEQVAGTLAIESAPGAGTTVNATLPLAPAPGAARAATPVAAS